MTRTGLRVALLALLSLPSLAMAADGPMAQLKAQQERLDKLIKRKDSDRSAIKAIVNQMIDYRELGQKAMAQHWAPLKPEQQDEFVKTFNELIEKNYVKQLRTNVEYSLLYKGETITGAEALVATVIKVQTKGKSTETTVDYKMKKTGERWLIVDMVTDEVSMARNYKAQFNKIINQETFDGLLKKMRKKIADADAEK